MMKDLREESKRRRIRKSSRANPDVERYAVRPRDNARGMMSRTIKRVYNQATTGSRNQSYSHENTGLEQVKRFVDTSISKRLTLIVIFSFIFFFVDDNILSNIFILHFSSSSSSAPSDRQRLLLHLHIHFELQFRL